MNKTLSIFFIEAVESLNNYYEKWEDVYKNGDNTSSESDGMVLSHIRYKIIYLKKKLELLSKDTGLTLPHSYYKELPQEVDKFYNADKPGLIARAKDALNAYLSDPYYCKIVFYCNTYSEKEMHPLYAPDCLNVISNLKNAIYYGQISSMKKLADKEKYLNIFRICANNIDKYIANNEAEIDTSDLYTLKTTFDYQ